MHKMIKLALTAAIPVLLLAGCSDFLKGPGLTTNPNQPVTATPDQLWIGIEVAVMAQYENYPLMLFMTWVQGIAGVNRQWQTYASYNGGTDQGAAEGAWNQTYGPGGLRDLLTLDSANTANGNLQWRGQAEVLEALYMGTAADIWGDVPWSDSAGHPQKLAPTYDTQAVVYAHVQALLDSAITDLGGGGTLPAFDFFYSNDAANWKALAHTLKARFWMHTAQTSAGVYDPAHLDSVIAEANQGINSAANDLLPNHTSNPGSQNLFYSFQFSRAGDVAPASTHIQLVKEAEDTAQLTEWYAPPTGQDSIYGSVAGLPNAMHKPYAYPADTLGSTLVAQFEVTFQPAAEYPFVSYAENQMLLAEAQARKGPFATGVTTLNNYRATLPGTHSVLVAANVDSALIYILREKYVQAFFNMEPWNDYLRTCYPNIPQPQGVNNNAAYVPGRLPVGQTEQATNPNVPNQNNGSNPMNANNFKLANALDGTACIGQAQLP